MKKIKEIPITKEDMKRIIDSVKVRELTQKQTELKMADLVKKLNKTFTPIKSK